MTDHPMQPTPEQVGGWRLQAPNARDGGATREHWIARTAYAAGADAQLKACADAIYEHEGQPLCGGTAEWLRAAMRPKTLAEQAEKELDSAVMRGDCITTTEALPTLRRALERLAELEGDR